MTIFAIDPGPVKSALVVVDAVLGSVIERHQHTDNTQLLRELREHPFLTTDVLVIEAIASFGMPVGAEVFLTCEWSGRFIEAWAGTYEPARAWARLKRHEIKQTLCNSMKAKDPNIRQALIDRFGGKDAAIGRKKTPGPLYGISGDEWSALAVAIAYIERNGAQWNKQ